MKKPKGEPGGLVLRVGRMRIYRRGREFALYTNPGMHMANVVEARLIRALLRKSKR